MAAEPERLDVNLAAATHQDMLQMVEYEKKNRKKLLDLVSSKRRPLQEKDHLDYKVEVGSSLFVSINLMH